MKNLRTILIAGIFLATLSSCECLMMLLAGYDCNTGEPLVNAVVAAVFDLPQAPPPGSNNNQRGTPITQEIVGSPTNSQPGGGRDSDKEPDENASFSDIISNPTFTIGPSMSWLGGDKEEGEKFPARPGFQLGADWQIPITDAINLEPGLHYANRGLGYKREESGYYEPGVPVGSYTYGQRKKLHYLELPIFVSGQVANGLELYGGPQIGFLMGAKIVNESNGETTSTEKGTKGLNKVDLGLSAGARYQIPNSFFSVSLGYYHGFSNLSAGSEYGGYGYDEPKYFTRAARLGLQYNFPKAKKHVHSDAVKKATFKSWVVNKP